MHTVKDAAIQDIFDRLNNFANLILQQLSLLEKLISSDSLVIPKELFNEFNSNE